MTGPDLPVRPDPAVEIRMTALHATRAANYWSREPVTRMDVVVGAFEDISSAQVPGVTASLVATMPGLVEHRCSIGERGGFISRLRRGTYAPHIIEHVALELQTMMGHDVGFGKTRGGDVEGEYTLVFEHRHEQVGLRAAALALETVQQAFDGALESVDAAVAELRAIAETPDVPPAHVRVMCGITGGGGRVEAQRLLRERLNDPEALVIDVSPAYLLQAGLPYARSNMAIILDAKVSDVPPRYREEERATQLVNVLCDAVERDGMVVCPAKAWEIQDYARESGCRIAVFATDDDVTSRDSRRARAVARVVKGRIVIEGAAEDEDAGPLDATLPASSQVAVALAHAVLRGAADK
jgi:cyanophycin synthase-like protein